MRLYRFWILSIVLHGLIIAWVIGQMSASVQGVVAPTAPVIQAFVLSITSMAKTTAKPVPLQTLPHSIAAEKPVVNPKLSRAIMSLPSASATPSALHTTPAPAVIQALLRHIAARLQQQLIYPLAAQSNQQTGTVIIEFTLLPSGQIQHIQIIDSSGYPLLDQAAVATVQAIQPITLQGGVTQAITLRAPVVFVLHSH